MNIRVNGKVETVAPCTIDELVMVDQNLSKSTGSFMTEKILAECVCYE